CHRISIDVRKVRRYSISQNGCFTIIEWVVPDNERLHMRRVSFDHILSNGFSNQAHTLRFSLTPSLLSENLDL
ncbi:hypothetical protein L0F63_000672, partial [Massospora cicadina]